MTHPSLREAPPGGKGQSTRPYSAVPHDLVRDRRLLPTDVLVAAALLLYARDKPACWPSIKTLQADTGKSRRTVQMSLARLRGAGWVATEPAENPTGRVIVLAWRRGAQPAAGPGRSQVARPPGSLVAPEWKKQGEETGATHGERKAPEPQPTHAELLHRYAESGWLDRPPGDYLRRLAEARLSEALRGPRVTPTPAGPPPARRSQGDQRRRHGEPRRLFG